MRKKPVSSPRIASIRTSALVRVDDGNGLVAPALLDEGDRASELDSLGIDERLERVHPRHLLAVVGSQPMEVVEESGHRSHGPVERLEIALVLGEQIAALPGLGRLQVA